MRRILNLILPVIVGVNLFGYRALAHADAAYPNIIGNTDHLESIGRSLNLMRNSSGYVLGILADVSNQGYIFNTLEGQIKLGRLSTSGGILDQSCYDKEMISAPKAQPSEAYETFRLDAVARCTDNVTPWPFSNFHGDYLNAYTTLGTDYVLASYNSYYWIPIVGTDTYLSKIYPVDPSLLKAGDSFQSETVPSRLSEYKSSFTDGRIVKASLDGTIRVGYIVTIQVGNSGSQFQQMNVDSDKMYDYILKAMASGHYLRVFYYWYYETWAFIPNFIHQYKNNLRVYQVKIIDDPS